MPKQTTDGPSQPERDAATLDTLFRCTASITPIPHHFWYCGKRGTYINGFRRRISQQDRQTLFRLLQLQTTLRNLNASLCTCCCCNTSNAETSVSNRRSNISSNPVVWSAAPSRASTIALHHIPVRARYGSCRPIGLTLNVCGSTSVAVCRVYQGTILTK